MILSCFYIYCGVFRLIKCIICGKITQASIMLSCNHHDVKYDCDLSIGFKTWYSYLDSVPFHALG